MEGFPKTMITQRKIKQTVEVKKGNSGGGKGVNRHLYDGKTLLSI